MSGRLTFEDVYRPLVDGVRGVNLSTAPELLTVPNIVLTPHIGSATRTSRVGMAMLAARNLIAWARGEPLLTPVAAS